MAGALPKQIACAIFGAVVTRESGKQELVRGAYQPKPWDMVPARNKVR